MFRQYLIQARKNIVIAKVFIEKNVNLFINKKDLKKK
jgi:hypothetical protein